MRKIFCILSATAFLLTCCNSNKTDYLLTNGFAQGTTWHITYQSQHNEDLTDTFNSILNDFDFSMSTYNPKSLITKVNNGEDVELDSNFVVVFNSSVELWNLTGGIFDPSCRPLVNAWGFAKHESLRKPSQEELDSILQFVGMDKFKIVNNKLVRADNRATLNFNANAQGYSVDLVCDYLKSKGYKNYLVEIGGETRSEGVNPKGEPWRVGIDAPLDGSTEANREIQAVVPLSGKSLCSSGNYRNFFEKDGVKYSHELNPKTGYPQSDSLLAVSIVTPTALVGDGLATAVMVMGLENGFKLIDSLPETEGYFIYSSSDGTFKTMKTKNFEIIPLQ